MANTKTIVGSQLKAGDAIRLLGRYVRIIGLRPYDGDFAKSVWPEGGVRIATLDTGGDITIEPSASFDIPAEA